MLDKSFFLGILLLLNFIFKKNSFDIYKINFFQQSNLLATVSIS